MRPCRHSGCINYRGPEDVCPKPYYCRDYEVMPAVEEQVIVHRHSDMSKQDYDLIQQTARRVTFLEKKLSESLAKRKPRGYQQYKNT